METIYLWLGKILVLWLLLAAAVRFAEFSFDWWAKRFRVMGFIWRFSCHHKEFYKWFREQQQKKREARRAAREKCRMCNGRGAVSSRAGVPPLVECPECGGCGKRNCCK